MNKKIKPELMTLDQCKYSFGSRFPSSSTAIADLRLKVESIRNEMDEYLEVIRYMEKLQRLKKLMSN